MLWSTDWVFLLSSTNLKKLLVSQNLVQGIPNNQNGINSWLFVLQELVSDISWMDLIWSSESSTSEVSTATSFSLFKNKAKKTESRHTDIC